MSENLSLEEALHILRTETVTHGNDQVRVIDVLYMLSRGISAKSEKEQDLQSKINNILNLLSSDDVSLDEFQEIVNFIKANKSKLDNLSVPNIAGLAEALAEKVNANAEGLTPENITKWKEKLGVGELPSNIATIDEGNKQGNTYTKEKVDELLSGSAGGNGKNLANADLQIPAGTVRTLNVTGAKFGIQGLENKKADASFGNKIVVNNRGQLALSDNVEYTMNVPSNLSLNLNVNYTGITATPPNPTQLETKVRNLIEQLRDIEYIPLLKENWQETFKDESIVVTDYINEASENGWLNMKVVETNSAQETGILISQRTADVKLPTNKDWLVRFDINSIWRGWQLGIGELDSISFGFYADGDNVILTLNGGGVVAQVGMGIGLIAKTDNVITSMLFANGQVFVRSEMLNNTTNHLKIKARIIGAKHLWHWFKAKVYYKVFN